MQWKIIALLVATATLFFASFQNLDGGIEVAPVQSAQATSTNATSTANTGAAQEPKPVKPSSAVLRKELVPICACESRGNKNLEPRHFDDNGEVRRGKINPRDIGICQINLDYHEAAAKRKGLDLFDRNDNITYANWLYSKEGSTPWNWSRSCWDS